MFKRILREQRGEILRTANLTFTSDPEIIWMTNRRLFSIAFRDTGDTFVSPEAHQKGYSRVSVYMNSDNDTILSRRFDALHPRLLLYLQVEITDLESQLKELDDEELLNKTTQRNKSDRDDNGSKYGSKYSISAQYAEASYNYAISETRQHLLKERLKNCDTAPRQLSRPSKRVHQNSKDRTETDNSFEGGEKQFIFHESDFVVPNSQREDSWLDEFIHRAIIPRRLRLRPGISVGSHNRTPIPSKGRQKLFKFLKNCIQLLTSGLAFTLPLSLIRHANGATIPSAAPTIPILPDPVSSSGPSVGEAISALLIAIVGIVVWHCVKHSPKRRPYLIISLLIVAWIYSTVVANGGGMWPISSLWLCSLVNVLLLVREDMLDLNLGLSYGVSVVLVGNFLDGALSSISASTHFLKYLPHAIVLSMIVSGGAIRMIRLIRWLSASLSPQAAAAIQSWIPEPFRHYLGDDAQENQDVETGVVISSPRHAAIGHDFRDSARVTY